MTLQRSNFTRHRRKPDANQAEVVAALRAAGYAVLDLHRVGEGVPDLLVADERTGHQVLVEIKMEIWSALETKLYLERHPADKPRFVALTGRVWAGVSRVVVRPNKENGK